MSVRGTALLAVLSLGLAGGACGRPEQPVVDKYFNAVKARDNQTLSSFASVRFEKPVQTWRIKQTLEETTEPLALPALVDKLKQAEAAQAANKKEASAYSLDHYNDIEQVNDLKKKNKPVPAKFGGVASRWDEFNKKDRDAKKAVAEAKEALERERRSMSLSVGTTEGLEDMQGEVKTKKIVVDVTIGGQTQPYVMTLKRYDVKREGGGPRVVSRWMVQSLHPQQQGG
jgi:hypothetical protein